MGNDNPGDQFPAGDDHEYEASHFFTDLEEAIAAARAADILGFSFRLEDRWTVEEVLDPHTESTRESVEYWVHIRSERSYGGSDDQ